MSSKIYIPTPKIWDYYYDNRFRLWNEEDMVARNDETGVVLTVSGDGRFPELTLYNKDDIDFEWKEVHTREECNATAVALITQYVLPEPEKEEESSEKDEKMPEKKQVNEKTDAKDEVDDDLVDLIYEREDELRLAAGDFLMTVLYEKTADAISDEFGKDFIPKVVDDFLQYLRDKHEISVYRPTIVHNEKTGEDEVDYFPYGWPEN